VPTARLRVLFVLVVLAHHRRRVVHFNVTEHPTAAWTAQQIVDAFPDDSAPCYLLRDRGQVYGEQFCRLSETLPYGSGRSTTSRRRPPHPPSLSPVMSLFRRAGKGSPGESYDVLVKDTHPVEASASDIDHSLLRAVSGPLRDRRLRERGGARTSPTLSSARHFSRRSRAFDVLVSLALSP
jgi:hypothetical protein